MSILDRARQLVCQMNEFEAHRQGLLALSVQDWPQWAQRDFKLACDAMVEVRGELLPDKERIDWLDRYREEHDLVFEEGDPDVGVFPIWQVWRAARGAAKPIMVAYEPSLRAAIDAARK